MFLAFIKWSSEPHKYYRLTTGGTEIFASPLLAVLDSDDFDECSDPRHHDCHAHALCFNTQGSFSCACKAGFSDHGTEELPGRLCAGILSPKFFIHFVVILVRSDINLFIVSKINVTGTNMKIILHKLF